ncbi:MAG: Sb-PDE family phosphodiesterase [Fermentimonas sp.]|nr:Sb-PDE family phosphodiesterase [Fermentimonas sp.]MDD3189136.1 Sb-PDE family phosphodiesterase [Fermentimonas sp.]MDD3511374.1 Sb-PDE family phosphodiesterase [Fermentimonas sp.]MDD4283884.1 Sb-PDE family phosphodiesterase [Fermentimonas sp.]MDD4723737.1 Sb-PDE family phosphodiesterase [Fermentimonas sp.]
MKQRNLLIIGFLLIPILAFSQIREVQGMKYLDENKRPVFRGNVIIPNVGEYHVLKCDFHTHTVFSDGHVWPNVRNQEVWEEGLDSYAITDHVEYTPHKADVNVNHNRGYELLKESADKSNLILVKGTEITRNTPPGHFNAIYINDASGFIEDRATNEHDKAAVMKAAEQDAFIFWNHPGWQPGIEGSYEWIPFVDDLYKNKALHGIEVVNGFGIHIKALDWCLDKGLTVMGTSDIHNLVAHDYDLSKDYVHRTMTLVMAKERSAESIREALDEGRTVAWASKYLLGKEDNVRALFNACVELMPAHFTETRNNGSKINHYEIRNNSDLYFELSLTDGSTNKNVTLYPRSTQLITANEEAASLTGEVVSTYVRSDQHLKVNFPLN